MSEALISIYDLAGLDRLQRSARLDASCVRRLCNDLLKRFMPDEAARAAFPASARLAPPSLELFHRADSRSDGATKLLLRTQDGLLVESVILRATSGRTTLCVSSQVGCAAACDFCATGKSGLARNLSSDEILDQVLRAGQLLTGEDRVVRNVVFMGMGEPFHNEKNVHDAVERLTTARLFNHSPKKILVSTVGVPAAMLRFAERFDAVNLALSLHSVRAEVRQQLIPSARRSGLEELHATIERLNQQFGRRIMIEYLMLGGVNDSIDDARELVRWLEGLDVHLNLIPYNPIAQAPHLVGSTSEVIAAFGASTKAAGVKTTTRRSLGNDIGAACGQLARQENLRPTSLAVAH